MIVYKQELNKIVNDLYLKLILQKDDMQNLRSKKLVLAIVYCDNLV